MDKQTMMACVLLKPCSLVCKIVSGLQLACATLVTIRFCNQAWLEKCGLVGKIQAGLDFTTVL